MAKMNFELVDEFFDRALPILQAALRKQHGDGFHIDRWPHENPALEAWWESNTNPGLSKSVTIHVIRGDGLPFTVRMEGNAWSDFDHTRKWHYENLGEIEIPALAREDLWAQRLSIAVRRSIEAITGWDPTILERTDEIAVLST